MKKTLTILLTALLTTLAVFISCEQDSMLDEKFTAKITFNANGGEGEMKAQVVESNTPVKLSANKFTKNNYEFICWCTDKTGESGDTYGDRANISISKNITLYAQWKQNLVTITFHANNGSDPETTKVQNALAGMETTLDSNTFTKTGYYFFGWAESAEGESKYNNEDSVTITEALDLYAVWKPGTGTPYTVNHYLKNLDGEKYTLNSTDNKTGTTDTILTLADLKKSIEGFSYSEGFSGTETKGTTKPTSEAVITATILAEGNLVIDLYYSREMHKVTLTGGDGINSTSGAGTYAYGETVSIDATLCDNYSWSKWTQTTGGAEVSKTKNYSFTMGTNDITYTANASPLFFVVKFDKNNPNAGGSMNDYKTDKNGKLALPESTFTNPSDYEFVRWSTTSTGTEEYEVGEEKTFTKDVTLYAIWAKKMTNSNMPTTWTGRYAICDSLTSNTRVTVSGTAKIYLTDNTITTVHGGINVESGNEFIVNKLGSTGGELLVDQVADSNAGIGSGQTVDCGKITINAGTVITTGGKKGAGIGGGEFGGGGTITINGGTVTANGSEEYGAGIGGGYARNAIVVISGGIVNATGGNNGAGIGSGGAEDGSEVTIKGGTVTANGKGGSAGIGGGINGGGGTITISGGTVIATGGNQGGAGIGSGKQTASISISGGNVTISGGTVTATGGTADADGIGGGKGADRDGTLSYDASVHIQVSSDGTSWNSYTGSNRMQYMKSM